MTTAVAWVALALSVASTAASIFAGVTARRAIRVLTKQPLSTAALPEGDPE